MNTSDVQLTKRNMFAFPNGSLQLVASNSDIRFATFTLYSLYAFLMQLLGFESVLPDLSFLVTGERHQHYLEYPIKLINTPTAISAVIRLFFKVDSVAQLYSGLFEILVDAYMPDDIKEADDEDLCDITVTQSNARTLQTERSS